MYRRYNTRCYMCRPGTYLADHDVVRADGGSKSAPPEAGIGGVMLVSGLDGRRRCGDAEDQCSANQGK